VVSTMADPIYGIHQSQPYDIYSYMKANAKKLNLVGRFSYLPNLLSRPNVGLQDGMDFIISDEIAYYDEPMLNGQVRRYAKIRTFLADYSATRNYGEGNHSIKLVEDEIIRLGYTDLEIVASLDDATGLAAYLGIDHTRLGNMMNAAEVLDIRAGVPSYVNDSMSIMDAPHDGEGYARVNGEWVLSDHMVHPDIDGGTATV